MLNSDKEFIDFVVRERMQEYYQNWEDNPHTYKKEIDEGYLAVMDMLSEERQEAIKRYCSELISNAADETEFFYYCGIKDGVKLYWHILEMIKE